MCYGCESPTGISAAIFRCVIDTSPESALCKISNGINDADKLGGYIADQGLILSRAVFAELSSGLPDIIKNALKNILDEISKISDTIYENIKNLAVNLEIYITSAFSNIKDMLVKNAQDIYNTIIQPIIQFITDSIITPISTLIEKLVEFKQIITDSVSNAVGNVSGIFLNLKNSITGVLKEIPESIEKFLNIIIDSMNIVVTGTVNGMNKGISTVVGGVNDGVNEVVGGLNAKIIGGMNNAITGLQGSLNKAMGKVVGGLNNATKGMVDGLNRDIVGGLNKATRGMVDGINNKLIGSSNYETMLKTDFGGNDIKNLDNSNLQQCIDACNGDIRCLGFNHNNPIGNGTCWLKHTLGTRSNTNSWTFYKKTPSTEGINGTIIKGVNTAITGVGTSVNKIKDTIRDTVNTTVIGINDVTKNIGSGLSTAISPIVEGINKIVGGYNTVISASIPEVNIPEVRVPGFSIGVINVPGWPFIPGFRLLPKIDLFPGVKKADGIKFDGINIGKINEVSIDDVSINAKIPSIPGIPIIPTVPNIPYIPSIPDASNLIPITEDVIPKIPGPNPGPNYINVSDNLIPQPTGINGGTLFDGTKNIIGIEKGGPLPQISLNEVVEKIEAGVSMPYKIASDAITKAYTDAMKPVDDAIIFLTTLATSIRASIIELFNKYLTIDFLNSIMTQIQNGLSITYQQSIDIIYNTIFMPIYQVWLTLESTIVDGIKFVIKTLKGTFTLIISKISSLFNIIADALYTAGKFILANAGYVAYYSFANMIVNLIPLPVQKTVKLNIITFASGLSLATCVLMFIMGVYSSLAFVLPVGGVGIILLAIIYFTLPYNSGSTPVIENPEMTSEMTPEVMPEIAPEQMSDISMIDIPVPKTASVKYINQTIKNMDKINDYYNIKKSTFVLSY
jgi:phage-related protein